MLVQRWAWETLKRTGLLTSHQRSCASWARCPASAAGMINRRHLEWGWKLVGRHSEAPGLRKTQAKKHWFTPKTLYFSLEQHALIMYREIKWRRDQTQAKQTFPMCVIWHHGKALPQDTSVQTFQWQCDWCETDRGVWNVSWADLSAFTGCCWRCGWERTAWTRRKPGTCFSAVSTAENEVPVQISKHS